jgi:hypothetical protein
LPLPPPDDAPPAQEDIHPGAAVSADEKDSGKVPAVDMSSTIAVSADVEVSGTILPAEDPPSAAAASADVELSGTILPAEDPSSAAAASADVELSGKILPAEDPPSAAAASADVEVVAIGDEACAAPDAPITSEAQSEILLMAETIVKSSAEVAGTGSSDLSAHEVPPSTEAASNFSVIIEASMSLQVAGFVAEVAESYSEAAI